MATLGELERSVMELLWTSDADAHGQRAPRRAVDARTSRARAVATTTVLTVLSRLERKGFVTRDRARRAPTAIARC